MTSNPIIVLGMHRSGTSALAGSLERAGVALGDVVQEAPDNLKGSRESRRLMALHEDLLRRGGGSWREPPDKVRWEAVHHALRDAHVDNFANHARWGFKDPRTLLVLDGWLAACPDATLVGIFRHPFHVAESLHRRNGMDHEEALELWQRYNRVLHWYRDNRSAFPLIEFADDAADVAAQLRALAAALELPDPPEGFFDDAMRRDAPPELPSSPRTVRALELHARLQGLRTFPA